MNLQPTKKPGGEFNGLILQIAQAVKQARSHVRQSVNRAMVASYWEIGRLIVEHEQQGQARAEYGKQQLEELSRRLTEQLGKGFDPTNLRNIRRFYRAFPIQETLSLELSWSHYVRLIKVENANARQWYPEEAISHLQQFLPELGKLKHQDVGQMDTSVRLYDETIKGADDGPTVGLLLCSEKSEAVAKYSVLADQRQLFAAKYLPYLPSEAELQRQLERERMLLQAQQEAQP